MRVSPGLRKAMRGAWRGRMPTSPSTLAATTIAAVPSKTAPSGVRTLTPRRLRSAPSSVLTR